MSELKRILLVEDNPNDLALALSAFEELHLANEVVIARDGQEALDRLRGEGSFAGQPRLAPVVVLLDLKLPRLDGLEVLAQIKGSPELRLTPVVMLTSSQEENELVRAYGLGVNACVVKPISFADFVHALLELGLFWGVVNQPSRGGAE